QREPFSITSHAMWGGNRAFRLWRAIGTRSQMHQSLRKHSSLMVIVENILPVPFSITDKIAIFAKSFFYQR
ncbi:MAG: hypothetical protein K6F40_01500, partial [Bacteroidales bacterium]|nr:hypothetical protein [Bacteroidales bacterium]